MDPNKAIQFGQLVQAAYAIPPSDLSNRAGMSVDTAFDPLGLGYQIITTIFGCDLATDMNPNRGNNLVSFGYVLQDKNNDVVISVRGTEGIWEWIHDAEFLYTKCPCLAGAGETDDGFTVIYNSLRVDAATDAPRIINALLTLPFRKPVGSLTICGHSLGAALATLLALDIGANSSYESPTVYTYASPRTGDPLFAATYNVIVPNTFRIANRVDIVPKLPLPPMYEHVLGLCELNPITLGPPPQVLVKLEFTCQHILTTYLYLLSSLPGVIVQQPQVLDPQCK